MFNTLLSPAAREELAFRQKELTRLYHLSNHDLGNELLRLVQAARLERPDMTPAREVYDSSLLWHIVPELARRLGVQVAITDSLLSLDSHVDFRRTLGIYLRWVSHYEKASPAWNLLVTEACNGNPLVYAMDRICKGNLDDPDDWITRGIKEVARNRGTPYTGVWTPAVAR